MSDEVSEIVVFAGSRHLAQTFVSVSGMSLE